MKSIIFLIALFFCEINLNAQNFHVTLFGGFSNYQGDLTEKNYTLKQSHIAEGIGVLYELNNHLNIRGNINIGNISGNDKFNPKNYSRNLSFSSPLTDIDLGLEYCLFDLNEKIFTPFIFGGVSYYHFNPSAIDSLGRKVFLQPLSTEGEGFYLGRKIYKLNQVSIPFGGGIKVAVNENIQISFEIIFRKTFTDYLDDVSTNYIDQNLLLTNRGAEAVMLAFRGNELSTGATYPADGLQRGNPKNKDIYYFSGITISYKLHSNDYNGYGGKKNKSRLGCPTNVY